MTLFANAVPDRHSLLSLRRLYWLRWVLLLCESLLLVGADTVIGLLLPHGPLLTIFGLQAVFNVLTGWRLRQHARGGTTPGEAELMGQLLVDLTALSAILFFTGGATNPFVSFYLPGLALAAALLPAAQVAALAVYALACYTVMLFEYMPLELRDPTNAIHYHLAGMWLNFVASAIMIALFVARLSGTLRRRDAELHQAREQLLREARADALDAQAATVAHEIGTPLGTLAVIAGELRADAAHRTRGETAVRHYAADLDAIEQQLALCRSILARLRDNPASTSAQPVSRWLITFLESWHLRHPDGRLQTSIADEAAALPVEPARTGQMLTILLDNAVRSQQAAGRPELPLDLTIAVERRDGHASLIFRVADRGTGIPLPLRSMLGEAPVASLHGGQGIGAYLAQSAARQAGGRVIWRDRVNGGTTAELRLPIHIGIPERRAA